MPFRIDIDVSEERQKDRRFTQTLNALQQRISNQRTREEIAIHEGGHWVYYLRAGAINGFNINVPSITYDEEKDCYPTTGGTVQPTEWDAKFWQSSPADQLFKVAVAGVAGEIALVTLRKTGIGSGSGDWEAFLTRCQRAGVTESDCTRIWQSADDYVRKDIQHPDMQSAIALTSEELLPLLFIAI